jgi:hypothetical protein
MQMTPIEYFLAADPNLAEAFRRAFPKRPGTDWDQLAQDDRDAFDARLDAMPEPLGGDDE